MPKHLRYRLQPSNVPMVIRAENDNKAIEAAIEFVAHVGDIGGEIRRLAVGAQDDPVFVVAELSGLHPERALSLLGVPAAPQVFDAVIQLTIGIERCLVEVDVEVDAEAGHCLPNITHDDLGRYLT